MGKVTVADGPDFGLVVTEVKGMRGGCEWVTNEIQEALVYDLDGSVRVRWLILGWVPMLSGAIELNKPRSLPTISSPSSLLGNVNTALAKVAPETGRRALSEKALT
jgi:hypothetical protein